MVGISKFVRHSTVAAMVFALAAPMFAAQQTYQIDPAHSSVGFAVKHLMVSTVRGRFTDFSGTIIYDDQDPTKSSVRAIVKTSSINTDNERRDNHLKGPDFFDAPTFPEMKFESTRVEKRGDQLVAIGNLTIKDVTKQVELPFSVAVAEAKGKKRMGVETATSINRYDYHVEYDKTGATVGKDVKIELNLEAVAQEAAAAAAAQK